MHTSENNFILPFVPEDKTRMYPLKKGGYLFPKRYLPFSQKVLTFFPKGTYLFPKRYLPFSQKERSFLSRGAPLFVKRSVPFLSEDGRMCR
jgi:hypothetical protein